MIVFILLSCAQSGMCPSILCFCLHARNRRLTGQSEADGASLLPWITVRARICAVHSVISHPTREQRPCQHQEPQQAPASTAAALATAARTIKRNNPQNAARVAGLTSALTHIMQPSSSSQVNSYSLRLSNVEYASRTIW